MGMRFCLAEGYLKNGSGEVSGSLSAFAACQAEVPGADIEAHAEVAPEQGAAGGEGGGEGAQQSGFGGVGEQQGGVYSGMQLLGREVGGAGQGFGSGVLREAAGRRGGGEVGFEQQPKVVLFAGGGLGAAAADLVEQGLQDMVFLHHEGGQEMFEQLGAGQQGMLLQAGGGL